MTPFKKGDIVLFKRLIFPPLRSSSSLEVQIKTMYTVVIDDPFALGGRPAYRLLHVSSSVHAEDIELAPTVYCKDQEFAPDGWHRKENVTAFNGEIYWHDGDKSWQDRGWKYSLRDRDSDEWTHGLCADSYEAARAAVEEIVK